MENTQNNGVEINTNNGLIITTDHQVEVEPTGAVVITTQTTIRQAAQAAVDALGSEQASSVVVSHSDGTSESFSGPDSPSLFQKNPETGAREERPLPEGSTVSVQRSARGAWFPTVK